MKLRAVCSREDEFLSGQSPVGIAADEFRDSHHPYWGPHCLQYSFFFFFCKAHSFFKDVIELRWGNLLPALYGLGEMH